MNSVINRIGKARDVFTKISSHFQSHNFCLDTKVKIPYFHVFSMSYYRPKSWRLTKPTQNERDLCPRFNRLATRCVVLVKDIRHCNVPVVVDACPKIQTPWPFRRKNCILSHQNTESCCCFWLQHIQEMIYSTPLVETALQCENIHRRKIRTSGMKYMTNFIYFRNVFGDYWLVNNSSMKLNKMLLINYRGYILDVRQTIS